MKIKTKIIEDQTESIRKLKEVLSSDLSVNLKGSIKVTLYVPWCIHVHVHIHSGIALSLSFCI